MSDFINLGIENGNKKQLNTLWCIVLSIMNFQ